MAATIREQVSGARVEIVPSDAIGTFRVAVDGEPLWSKFVDGGFPESAWVVESITRRRVQ